MLFEQALVDAGFSNQFKPVNTDGKWITVRDEIKNDDGHVIAGAGKVGYTYQTEETDKGTIHRFMFRIFRLMDDSAKIFIYPEKTLKKDIKKAEENWNKNYHKLQADIHSGHVKAKFKALEIWDKSITPKVPQEYFAKKGIQDTSFYRVNLDYPGACILPIYAESAEIWSLQIIGMGGDKDNLDGGKINGCFGVIGAPTEISYIAEGFATAASIYLATGKQTFVALNSYNLHYCYNTLKDLYPDRVYVICADNDVHLEKNKGYESAEKVAKRYGLILKMPVFTKVNHSKEAKDFDDLRRIEGLDECLSQLTLNEKDLETYGSNQGVIPLGLSDDGKEYYLTSGASQIIQCFSELSPANLLRLENLEYWKNHYGTENESGAQVVNWLEIDSKLKEQCRRKGIFDSQKEKGIGIWLDKNRIVVNCGDHLLVDGKKTPNTAIKSEFIYKKGKKITHVDLSTELSDEELYYFEEFGNILRLHGINDKNYLKGWLVSGLLGGVLKWNPHVALTGERGTGKSELITFISRFYDRAFQCHKFRSGSTVAGVRQTVIGTSIPVVLEEFEVDGGHKNDSIMYLCRGASSPGEHSIVHGSANGGKAKEYHVYFAVICAAINVNLKTSQDKSRWTQLVLQPKQEDEPSDQYERFLEITDRMLDPEHRIPQKFLATVINNLPILLKNIEFVASECAKTLEGRLIQQFGTLLVCAKFLENPRKLLTTEDANVVKEALLDSRDIVIEDSEIHSNGSTISGLAEETLEDILTAPIKIGMDTFTARRILSNEATPSQQQLDALSEYGLMYDIDSGDLLIRMSNQIKHALKQSDNVMAGANYLKILRRIKGTQKVQRKFQKKNYKWTQIPRNIWDDGCVNTTDTPTQF